MWEQKEDQKEKEEIIKIQITGGLDNNNDWEGDGRGGRGQSPVDSACVYVCVSACIRVHVRVCKPPERGTSAQFRGARLEHYHCTRRATYPLTLRLWMHTFSDEERGRKRKRKRVRARKRESERERARTREQEKRARKRTKEHNLERKHERERARAEERRQETER